MRAQREILQNTLVGCAPIATDFFLALLACALISLSSCKPTKEVQVERVEVPVVVTQEHSTESTKIDIVRDTVRQRDSVIYRDSVYHFVKGDTVIIEKWHYMTNNHHYANSNVATRVDTLIKVDSVEVPVEVVREKVVTKINEVEKPLRWWQQALMWMGFGLLCLMGYKVVRFKLR